MAAALAGSHFFEKIFDCMRVACITTSLALELGLSIGINKFSVHVSFISLSVRTAQWPELDGLFQSLISDGVRSNSGWWSAFVLRVVPIVSAMEGQAESGAAPSSACRSSAFPSVMRLDWNADVECEWRPPNCSCVVMSRVDARTDGAMDGNATATADSC